MYGYIYRVTVTNPSSVFNNCYYIGKSKYNKCDKKYHDSSLYLRQYKKKWGLAGLDRKILCECETEQLLNDTEKKYIAECQHDLFKNGGLCLNIALGGTGGDTISNNKNYTEICKKRSISESGIKNPMYGKNYQCYGLKRRTDNLKGKTFNEIFGKEKAKLIKEKFSKNRLGKKHSVETRLKMSKNNVGSKGMHWYNNGIKNYLGFNCPSGYISGRIKADCEKISKGRKARYAKK